MRQSIARAHPLSNQIGENLKVGYFLALALLLVGSTKADSLSVSVATSRPDMSTWSYTVTNNQPLGDPDYVFGFYVAVNAALDGIATPQGWIAQTDGYNYVFWSSTGSAPYGTDIAPGTSVTGFSVSADASSGLSQAATYGWNHGSDEPGPISYVTVDAPVAPASPEPSTLLLCGIPLMMLFPYIIKRKRGSPRTKFHNAKAPHVY